MPESQLKSQAIQIVSELRSLRSSVHSMPEATEDQRKSKLDAAKKFAYLSEYHKIEQRLSTANSKQIEAVEAFFSGDYRHVCMIGGNQSGKTVACGEMCFAKHLRDHAKKNSIYWCIAPSQERSVSKQQMVLWEILPRFLFGDQKFDHKNGFGSIRPTVILDPGKRNITIRFKSASQYDSDPRAFESEAIEGVWIDESIEEHHWDAILPRLIAKRGFSLTSAVPDVPWMYEKFENASPDALVKFVKLSVSDNRENLPPGAIEEMAANMSEDEAQMRIFGNFRFLQGLVYKEFIKEYKPEGHLVKPFKIPDDWPKWRCMDLGMSHPTVCLWCTVAPNETAYVYREYTSKGRSAEHDAKAIIGMSGNETYMRPVIADPSAWSITKANVRSVAQQFGDAGLPFTPAPRTQKMGEWAGVHKVKRWLESRDARNNPKFLVFDTCGFLISEFRKWKVKTDTRNAPLGSDSFEDKNNDSLDALRYWVSTNPVYEPPKIVVKQTIND